MDEGDVREVSWGEIAAKVPKEWKKENIKTEYGKKNIR